MLTDLSAMPPVMTDQEPQPNEILHAREALRKQIAALDNSIARLCIKQNILKIALEGIKEETELDRP